MCVKKKPTLELKYTLNALSTLFGKDVALKSSIHFIIKQIYHCSWRWENHCWKACLEHSKCSLAVAWVFYTHLFACLLVHSLRSWILFQHLHFLQLNLLSIFFNSISLLKVNFSVSRELRNECSLLFLVCILLCCWLYINVQRSLG